MHVFLGLGTNLGNREMNLVTAKDLLMKHDVLVLGQSAVLETKPLGGLDQPDYLNQVIECSTSLSPEDLLVACKSVEKDMGRDVSVNLGNVSFGSVKKDWESRVMDIDILYYGDQVVDKPGLLIPHYAAAERDFVLDGMRELDPNFVHPVLKKRMMDL